MKRFIIVSLALLVIAAVVTYCSAIAPGSFDAFYGAPRAIGFWGWFLYVLFWYWDIVALVCLPDARKWCLVIVAVLAVSGIVFRGFEEWERIQNKKTFAQECERMMSFPLPRKEAECSKNKYVEFILREKERVFGKEDADFNDKDFQEILDRAIDFLRRDGALAKSKNERVNCWTSLALLYFQCGYYEDSCVYSKKALDCEPDASLAQCIYATSYLYSKSAPDNMKVQKRHLVPAILAEQDNGLMPHVLNIYMDRLLERIHGGNSKPEELAFMFDLLEEKDSSKNAPYYISNLTERIVQELDQSQKDVEILTRGDVNKRDLDASVFKYKNFVGLKDILKQLLPYIKTHEKNLEKNLTFAAVQQQLNEFDNLEPKLKALITETKNRISSSRETEDIKGTLHSNQDKKVHGWNPLKWF